MLAPNNTAVFGGKTGFCWTSSDFLGHVLAESEGFEPPSPRGLTVFKTAAFDRSANSPAKDSTCAGSRHGPVNCRWHERANRRQDASREDLWPAGLGRGVPA